MMRRAKLFLAFEAVAFLGAGLVHSGRLIDGFEHRKAGIAGSTIGAVLLAGLVGSPLRPRTTRVTGLSVQAFALSGTLVGLFTIAIGVGPHTAPDLAFHAGIVVVLVTGLRTAFLDRRVISQSTADN